MKFILQKKNSLFKKAIKEAQTHLLKKNVNIPVRVIVNQYAEYHSISISIMSQHIRKINNHRTISTFQKAKQP